MIYVLFLYYKYKCKYIYIYVQYECVCLYLCWFKPFRDVLVENYHLLLHVCQTKTSSPPNGLGRAVTRVAWFPVGLPNDIRSEGIHAQKNNERPLKRGHWSQKKLRYFP